MYGRAGLRIVKEKKNATRTPKESGTRDGNSPVAEAGDGQTTPEYRGTREILWEAGGTTPQA